MRVIWLCCLAVSWSSLEDDLTRGGYCTRRKAER